MKPIPMPPSGTPALVGGMPAEEFRRAAHEAVEWIVNYLVNIRDYPVLAQVEPGALADSLPGTAPEQGEPFEAIFEDFRRLIVPGITHWNHPRFFAYFAISGSAPGILAEMLAAALNANGMLWKSSPAVTELEQVALGWLRQWVGLPESFFGITYDTASLSTLHAIAAARESADPQARTQGASPNLVLYCSGQAHSSVEKGAIAIGIGQRTVRKIPVDAEFRMRPDALREAVRSDVAAGRRPFCVVATAGTTSTTSVDPVPEIAGIAAEHNLWLHVDGAYGGSAAIIPEFRHVLAGAADADSVVINPHKWLLTPTDISAFYTRRPEILRRAFSLVPDYLRTADNPRAVNLMDYGVPLGRRFRALKLWFVMRYFGHQRMAAILRSHIDLARQFAGWVEGDGRFELAAPVPLSVVCFRRKGPDGPNQRLLEAVNSTGEAFLSHTVLNGRFVLRLAVGNMATRREDLELVWRRIQTEAARLED